MSKIFPIILLLLYLIFSPLEAPLAQSEPATNDTDPNEYSEVVKQSDNRLQRMDNALNVAGEERASNIRRKPYDTNIAASSYNPAYTAAQDDPAPGSQLPDWVKRTWFGSVIQSDQETQFYLETIQPLYQSADNENTVFTQGRVSMSNGNEDYSLGYGYRRLILDNTLMLGINNFFDFTTLRNHYRTGIGLEAITQAFEVRMNSYVRLSPKRYVGDTALQTIYERAANGLDIEVGGPLNFNWLQEMNTQLWAPDWLKLYAGYYWYDYKWSDDVQGLKFRSEIKPWQGFALNLSVFDDNDGPTRYQADVRVNLQLKDFRLNSVLAALRDAKTPATPPSLDTRTLDRVERNFAIQVERMKVRKPTLVGGLSNVQLVVRFPGENPVTTDNNSNSFVDPGEDFELDVLMTNTGSLTSTGISYANAIMGGDPNRIRINTSASLPDAPPGGTTRTDNGTDMDPSFYSTDTPGTQLFLTLDFTADGDTQTLTFGPFTVGAVYNGQVINVVN